MPQLAMGPAVLVIRPGGIGDAVLLLPALTALKGLVQPSRIDVLAEARNASVFALCDAVTQVYRYDQIRDLFRVVTRSYDIVIDTEQWHRLPAVLAVMNRSPVRVGFATNERARLFTHRVAYSQKAYEANSFLNLVGTLTPAAVSFDLSKPFLSVSPRSLGGDEAGPVVVLFPGASVPERRWGSERFGELAAKLGRNGCRVVVVGGPGDVGQSRVICLVGGQNIKDLTGACSLREVAEVLAGADVLVTADSGLMHLAVAVGTPTVSLFGAGIREKWAPRGDMHRVLTAELPCSPCTTFGHTPPCPIGVECLRRISVDAVLAATLDVVSQRQARGRHLLSNLESLPHDTAPAR